MIVLLSKVATYSLAAMAFVFLSTAIWKDVDYACHQTVWASYKVDKAIAEAMEQITR